MKQPCELSFFKGAFYRLTYNEDGKFSQSQMCLLFDLPKQSTIYVFKKFSVLVVPPGIKHIFFEWEKTLDDYISYSWVSQIVGTDPERTQIIQGRIRV